MHFQSTIFPLKTLLTTILASTGDSQLIQISALDTTLTAAQAQIENQLEAALTLLMSDVSTFISFADSGAFSGRQSLSLPKETQNLNLALKTYLTSEALLQNGWYGLYFMNDDGAGDAPGTTNFAEGDVFHNSDASLFWSKDSRREYQLVNKKSSGDPNNLLQTIYDNGLADLSVLFEGSFNCTASGECEETFAIFASRPRTYFRAFPLIQTSSGNAGGDLLHLGPDDRLDLSCISQLPIYYLNMACPSTRSDGSCLFGHG